MCCWWRRARTCTLIGTYTVVTAADVAAGQIDNTGTADFRSDRSGHATDPETVTGADTEH